MLLTSDLNALITLRRKLHSAPDLSGCEVETAEKIFSFLEQLSPDGLVRDLGGHGLAAIFDGDEEGPTVLVRCELDGLPANEQSNKPYRSRFKGRAHLCGHDGHMAIVCALAMMLKEKRPQNGRVILLFQPAEETGAGAQAVLSDPQFDHLKPDFAFALHNVPGFSMGDVYVKSGPLNCASRGMQVRLSGKMSHASQPEDGLSPISTIMALINAVTCLAHGNTGDEDFVLTTIVHARLGQPAYGIAPGDGEVWITLRTTTDDQMEKLVVDCEQLVHQLATEAGLRPSISYCDIFPASANDTEAAEIVTHAAAIENIKCWPLGTPMRWSEDFGAFGNYCKSAMFFVGSGENHPQLHNPDYDFPDELIDPGARMFMRIINIVLD